MIVAFSLQNYKSFRDLQTLSFTSSASDEYPEHIVQLDNGLKVSKFAAIIGANGVGKSQLISALCKFSEGIANNKVNELHAPYILCEQTRNEPTLYEVIITNTEEDIFLRYGASILNGKINEEYLYSRPIQKRAKESLIFNRDENGIAFSSEYKSQEKLIKPVIKDTGLIISFSSSLKIPEMDTLFSWAHRQVSYSPEQHKRFGTSFSEDRLQDIIDGTELAEELMPVDNFLKLYSDFISNLSIGIHSVKFLPIDSDGKHRFVYYIQKNDGTLFAIEPKERMTFFSQGTINLLAFIPTLLWSNSFGWTLYVDEIDSSLHYGLANSLLRTVINKICTLDNVQFIFSTHNVQLLDDCIRRDELNIIIKNESGESMLTNASKFSVRKDAKMSQKYFRGEFGSLPSFLEDSKAE